MKIFVTKEILEDGLEMLRQKGFHVDVWDGADSIGYNELKEKAANYQGLITMLSDKIDAPFLEQNNHLKVISNYAVGINNIDLETANKLSIHIGNTPEVLTDASADLTMALILATTRNILASNTSIKDGHWSGWEPKGFLGLELKNKTLGIFGAGRIGQAVAKRAHSFGMNILYHSRERKGQFEKETGAVFVEFPELLKRSDILSLHASLNEKTKDIINTESIQKMKEGAYFINIARGEMHCETALLKALESHHLAGVGLDVTNPEPMDKNSPLLAHPRAIITPHIGSATFHARKEMSLLCAKNILWAFNE